MRTSTATSPAKEAGRKVCTPTPPLSFEALSKSYSGLFLSMVGYVPDFSFFCSDSLDALFDVNFFPISNIKSISSTFCSQPKNELHHKQLVHFHEHSTHSLLQLLTLDY